MKKPFITVLSLITVSLVALSGCAQSQNTQNQITEEETTPESTIEYTNAPYSFSIEFPETWNDYSTEELELDWGTSGKSNSIDFSLENQEPLFNISIHTPEQWENITSEEGPTPAYLGETSQYIFAYSRAQDFPPELEERVMEVPAIIATFSIQ